MLNTDAISCIYLAHAPKDYKRLKPLLEKLWGSGFHIINLHEKHDTTRNPTTKPKPNAALIAAADQMLFALSPRSANTVECQHELEIAAGLNKRIIPAVIDELRGAPVPIALSRLNYIFFTPPTCYELSFDALTTALLLDIDKIREHAYFSASALSWEQSGQATHHLLSGKALEQAEQWLAAAQSSELIAATKLQQEFIATSRQHETQINKRYLTIILGVLALLLMSSAYGAALLLL